MSASYSGITASDNTRMHVGAHYGNSSSNTSTTTNYHNYAQPRRKSRLRWFGRRSEENGQLEEQRKEQRTRNEAFVKAVREKQRPRADYWYHQGIDIDFVDEEGCTALHCAAKTGYMVDYLLAKGYDVNAQDRFKNTPLCLAVCEGHLEGANQLLGAHASTHFGMPPPLYTACSHGDLATTKALVEAGAAVNDFRDFPSNTWTEKLRRYADSLTKATPLGLAVATDSADVVAYLLCNGADSNSEMVFRDDRAFPILYLAAKDGTSGIVELLLQYGANVDEPNHSGWSPLHGASWVGKYEIAKILLDRGAAPMVKTLEGCTPLHYAAVEGHADVANLLLESGADVMARMQTGVTPLHTAAMHGRYELAVVLLDRGADPMAESVKGWTPIHDATQNGHVEVARLLLDKGADVMARANKWTPLHLATWYGRYQVAYILLARGADVMAEVQEDWTALHYAAKMCHAEIAELLLETGANPLAKTSKGKTSYDIATQFEHHELAKLLAEREKDFIAKAKQEAD